MIDRCTVPLYQTLESLLESIRAHLAKHPHHTILSDDSPKARLAGWVAVDEAGNGNVEGRWDIMAKDLPEAGFPGGETRTTKGRAELAARLTREASVYRKPDPAILTRLSAKFEWIERQDMRVGALYLAAADIAKLAMHLDVFDRISSRQILETGLRGILWGANVWECEAVPPGRVCILPAGVNVSSIEAEATMAF